MTTKALVTSLQSYRTDIRESIRLCRGGFQRHHTNQAYYKSGIMPPEYHCILSIVQNSGLYSEIHLLVATPIMCALMPVSEVSFSTTRIVRKSKSR
jgi:hypothetical protein